LALPCFIGTSPHELHRWRARGPGPNQIPLGFIVAQSGRDGKEMPHWPGPLELPIRSDVVGTLSSGILDLKVLRNELRRSLSRAARRIGPLAAEGPGGLGMATPWWAWPRPPSRLL
jgi:hypothetical protein